MAGAFQTSGRMQGEDKRGVLGYVGEKFVGENPYNPEAGQLDYSRSNRERARGEAIGRQQGEFSNYLADAVAGRAGASVAEQQMRAGQAAAVQAARSQAASARGGNVALANRGAAASQAQGLQAANRDAAMLRAQEQISREQLLVQQQQNQRIAEMQARGMSIDEAKAQLQAETAAMQARTQISEGEATRGSGAAAAVMGAIGGAALMSDMRVKENVQPLQTGGGKYWNPGTPEQIAREDAQFQSNFGQELAALRPEMPVTTSQGDFEKLQQDRFQQQMANQQIDTSTPVGQAQQRTSQGLQSGMALGSMLSDRRAKMAEREVDSLRAELETLERTLPAQIRGPAPEQSRQDLGPVQPYTYRYKPEFAAMQGTDTAPRVGVMAQDLQQSPAYRASVIETPAGLALDKDRLLQANTAELGGLDKRLREIEAGLGKGAEYPTPRQPGERGSSSDEDERLMRELDAGQRRALEGVGRAR